MSILEQLKTNKGTVSSELGKKLADEVLNGKIEILKEAVEFASYCSENKKEKNVRSGASKIVECVAMEKPDMVSPLLEDLLPALDVDEPQTRWMIIRTFGFCAKEKPAIAQKAITFAQKYIREKCDGQLCLVSSADLFLGDYGETSKEAAKEVYPILLESCNNVIMNEHDWILESFIKISRYLTDEQKKQIIRFADEYGKFPRKKTQERVKKIMKICQ